MATLTETAYFARKGVNLAIILGIAFLIVRTTIIVGIALKERFFPTPPPPPNCLFGPLPTPNAQTNIATPSALTYTIETPDLSLPALPTTLKVYFMPPPPGPSFNSFNQMKAQAARLGFSSSPSKLTTSLYEFSDTDNPLRKLKLDEFSNNFHITYNYQSEPAIFNQKDFQSKDSIGSVGKSYFAGVVSLPAELSNTPPGVLLLSVKDGILTPATSISNTDAAIVTLNRANLDEMPIVSPEMTQGVVSVLLSGNSDPEKKILEARYFYAPIDRQNFATYPTVSSQKLFERLKANDAIFASVPKTLPKNIAIRKVYLAYLDPYPSQNYLQPVIVFSDEKGFAAYVRAILPECSQKQS